MDVFWCLLILYSIFCILGSQGCSLMCFQYVCCFCCWDVWECGPHILCVLIRGCLESNHVYDRMHCRMCCRWRMFLNLVSAPTWFGSLLVSLFCFLVCSYGLSQRRVGVGYALRVPPAVTRLTVYRRSQVYQCRGKCRQHNPRILWNKWMVSVDFLGLWLTQFGC